MTIPEITHRLTLFITGHTTRSERALSHLRAICEAELSDRYTLEVIDVLEEPERAEEERILATPMLVRRQPEPVRKIIGDLSDRGKVLRGLDIVGALARPTTRNG